MRSVVLCLFEQLFVAVPGDSLIGHLVGSIIDKSGRGNRVVKQGISNQPTGIISLLGDWVKSEWVTSTSVNGMIVQGLTFQLIDIQRLDISPMILVKIGQAVVKEHWSPEGLRYFEKKRANRCVRDTGQVDAFCALPRGDSCLL